MLRIVIATIVAVAAMAAGAEAFAQSCSSPPEPKTSAMPLPATTQPG